MIVDPENYLQNRDLSNSISYLKTLYEKYNISTYIFFISHINDKNKKDESYASFVSSLSYLIYKNNEEYDEENTIAVVFFIKDRKMRIRTSKGVRKIISDTYSLRILNELKYDLKNENYVDVINNLAQKLLNKYENKSENIDVQVDNQLIFFFALIIIFMIGLCIIYKQTIKENESKVKSYLDKLKKNPKEIFSESCVICLNDFQSEYELEDYENVGDKILEEKEDISILNCGHKFHRKCIIEWLKKSKTCPLCRTKCDINDNNSNLIMKESFFNVSNHTYIISRILDIQRERNFINENSMRRIRLIYSII